MRDIRRTAPFLSGNRIAVLLTAALDAVGVMALPATAIAGAGDAATVAKKKKKKKCPPGTHKVVIVKKKDGKKIKKRRCVPDEVAPTGALSITPTTFTFPDEQHGGDPGPAQTFTVTNTGGAASGALTTSIVDIADPVVGDAPAFVVLSNTCVGALPGGASCAIAAAFDPDSNGGDGNYTSLLQVTGAPGGTATASMFGHAD